MKVATLCYVEKDNQYLMLHRTMKEDDIHKNLWIGLGGKLEAGESPEECVIREVFEESGLKIISPVLRGVLTFPSFADDVINSDDWYVFLFTANNFSGSIKESDEGKLMWIDKEKLNEYPMHEGDVHFIEWIQKNKGVLSAKYIYENGVIKKITANTYHTE